MKELRIEDYLTEGEELVWQGQPKDNGYVTSHLINMLPAMLLWLTIECVILGYSVANKIFGDDFNVYYLIMTIAAVLLHLVPTAMWFVAIAKKNAEVNAESYAVTNKNLIIMHGNLHRAAEIIPISEIVEVNLSRSLASRIMGVGTVVIVTEEEKIYLHNQVDALKSFRRVYHAVNGGEKDGE